MTKEDKDIIIAWLRGPRNFTEGAALYGRFGHNRMIKRRLAVEDSAFTRSLLVEELRKISGISEASLRALPRRAARASAAAPHAEAPLTQPQRRPVDGSTARALGFRDRYPFLRDPGCPDAVKVMANDMFVAYDAYRAAFSRLSAMDDNDPGAAAETEAVVEAYIRNRTLWEALEAYKVTGALPEDPAPKSPVAELSELADVELMKRLNSAKANQSKRRTALREAEDAGRDTAEAREALDRWTAVRSMLETELERRKKKQQPD
ncbi:MAG: hypothetical protein K2H87_04970 [Duncaniella sp.]|nr:hypothetical protein [Duncaniella sp.]